MLGFEFHPAAEEEYLSAVRYYSRIRMELGYAFVDEIEAAINRARSHPEAYAKIYRDVRRVLARRFSFAIIFEVIDGRLMIWAVGHASRRPGYWIQRTSE